MATRVPEDPYLLNSLKKSDTEMQKEAASWTASKNSNKLPWPILSDTPSTIRFRDGSTSFFFWMQPSQFLWRGTDCPIPMNANSILSIEIPCSATKLIARNFCSTLCHFSSHRITKIVPMIFNLSRTRLRILSSSCWAPSRKIHREKWSCLMFCVQSNWLWKEICRNSV